MSEHVLPPNNIRRARQAAGMTQEQLARLTGVSQQSIAKMELDRVALKASVVLSIARALHVRQDELVGWEQKPGVPVIGRLSINDVIVKSLNTDPIEYEDAPPFAPPEMVAFIVAGDGMWPLYRAGDVIYVAPHSAPEHNIGEECAVETAEGVMLLKRVLRGRLPGRFDLASMAGPSLLEDQDLRSCRRVEFVRRGRRPPPH